LPVMNDSLPVTNDSLPVTNDSLPVTNDKFHSSIIGSAFSCSEQTSSCISIGGNFQNNSL
ncbi:MAG: hypothetical protein LBS25_03030, partial [Candidatus Symbiothrix sp.]|nr:hypothetical protein [Candidatus Symbiothrix sp.]